MSCVAMSCADSEHDESEVEPHCLKTERGIKTCHYKIKVPSPLQYGGSNSRDWSSRSGVVPQGLGPLTLNNAELLGPNLNWQTIKLSYH
jgi:hypothetical protein